MKPDPKFAKCSAEFWANVRIISQELGYTQRGTKKIKTYSLDEMTGAMRKMRLDASHLVGPDDKPTQMARLLTGYFGYRAKVLNNKVEPLLMNKTKAKAEFKKLKSRLKPSSESGMTYETE